MSARLRTDTLCRCRWRRHGATFFSILLTAMPEGDTLYLLATNLRVALAGRTLTKTDFRVPRFALADLSGQTLTEIVPRGKHLLMRTDGGWTIHSHLGLNGSWELYRARQRWHAEEHEIRAVLRTEDRVALGVLLNKLEIIKTAREPVVVGHLGPDPLGPDWDLDEALRRFRAHPDREIGDALLDQRIVAGWGNAYRNEICFLAGIDPWAKVRDVPLEKVIAIGRKTLLANRGTGRWVTTGDLRRNEGQFVMERAGRPCRRCGTTIVRARQVCNGKLRWTYWCPRCQPAAPGSARPERGRRDPIRAPRR